MIKCKGKFVGIVFGFFISILILSAGEVVSGFPRRVEDARGQAIEILEKPERIISVAPSTTETLYALEILDRVVGVTDFCDYPEEVREKETIGGFSTPSIEKIVELEPDLILASGSIQQEVVENLLEMGLAVIALPHSESIEDIFSTIHTIGLAAGIEERADGLIREMESEIDRVEELTADETKPGVFIEIWHDPLMTAGEKSFMTDLIQAAGGQNIFGNIEETYPVISLEVLIEKDPEIYIAARGDMADPGTIADREGWGSLKAVQGERVYRIDEDIVNRSGPRIIEGIQTLAEFIHPGLFD